MYNPIYENLLTLCKNHGTSITALCAKITGSSGNLITWKKGKIYADDLEKIRKELDISIDELLDNTIPPNTNKRSVIMSGIVQRIIKLMELKGDNPHSLEVNAELPISSVSAWKNNKYQPSVDSIIKLACYFNVSADYLLCFSNEPTPLKTANIVERPTYALSTELAELLKDKRFIDSAKLYKAMADEYKQEICTYILGIAVGLGLNVKQILGK